MHAKTAALACASRDSTCVQIHAASASNSLKRDTTTPCFMKLTIFGNVTYKVGVKSRVMSKVHTKKRLLQPSLQSDILSHESSCSPTSAASSPRNTASDLAHDDADMPRTPRNTRKVGYWNPALTCIDDVVDSPKSLSLGKHKQPQKRNVKAKPVARKVELPTAMLTEDLDELCAPSVQNATLHVVSTLPHAVAFVDTDPEMQYSNVPIERISPTCSVSSLHYDFESFV